MDNPNLSEREIEILKLLGQGKSNKDIAQELFISINTVKVHVNNVFKKLGVSSRTEATLYAIEHELIDNPRPDAEPVHIYVPISDPDAAPTPVQPSLLSKYWWLFLLLGVLLVVGLSFFFSNSPLFAEPTPTANPLIDTLNQDRWRELSPIPTPREGMAIAVWDGAIYTIGGRTADGVSQSVERYVKLNNRWESLEPKPISVFNAGAASVGGRIYVPGGELSDGTMNSVMEVYDPRAAQWSVETKLPRAISRYGIATYEGGIYLFGGWDGSNLLDSAWVYTPSQDEWQELPNLPSPRSNLSVTVMGENLYIFGGACEEGPCSDTYTFSPNLVGSGESPWKQQLTLEDDVRFMGAEVVSGSLFLFGELEDGTVQLRNYTSQNNMWYTYTEEPNLELIPNAQMVSLGGDVYFLGGTTSEGLPSSMLIRYQAVFTILLPQIGN